MSVLDRVRVGRHRTGEVGATPERVLLFSS